MSLEVAERLCDLGGPGKQRGIRVLRNLGEGEVVTLSIQGIDDLVEAQEISDERQIFTIARLIRMGEGSGNDVAELADVTHVNATHTGIDGKPPAQGSVRLLLRSDSAHEVLVVERRDDERVMHEPGFPDDNHDTWILRSLRNERIRA